MFCNPTSPTAPAKLRCLYETFPLALVAEAAGGATHDGHGSGGRAGMHTAGVPVGCCLLLHPSTTLFTQVQSKASSPLLATAA